MSTRSLTKPHTKRSCDGQKPRKTDCSTGHTRSSPYEPCLSSSRSDGQELHLMPDGYSPDSSLSSSLPYQPADRAECSSMVMDSASPLQPPADSNGSGSSPSSNGSGLSTWRRLTKGVGSLGLLSNDLRCNICNRIQRERVFIGSTCKCGCGAFWESKLTIYEWLMFRCGIWTRYDMSKILAVSTVLGGGRDAMRLSLDKISEPVKEP